MVRPREAMPDDVAAAISSKMLRDAYDARPAYQRNDYIRWIKSGKRSDTRQRRIDQMVAELRDGELYMGATWKSAGK